MLHRGFARLFSVKICRKPNERITLGEKLATIGDDSVYLLAKMLEKELSRK